MYGCESWTIKKPEHQRIDAFELWCWRRFLRVLWTCKEIKSVIPEGNQSWIFMEGLMLRLKLQYFGLLMWSADLLEKSLMQGKIEGRRRRDNRAWDGWMASSTRWTWVWANSRSSLVAQMVKSLPAVWETQLQSLGQEDPLEKEIPNHSSIYAWKTPWTEESGGLQSMVSQRVRQDWATKHSTYFSSVSVRWVIRHLCWDHHFAKNKQTNHFL